MESQNVSAQSDILIDAQNPIQVQNSEVVEKIEYAGFWVRVAANFVDGLVLFIPSLILQIVFGKNFGGLLGYVLMWTYAIYMINSRGATLGKMAVGLKVISMNTEELGVENWH